MEEYRLILESQLGPRVGRLRVENGKKTGTVTGTLTLLGYDNPVTGEWISMHSFRISHHLHTIVSDLSCVSVFEMEGNKISGSLQTNRNKMWWHGERMIGKKGGNKENGWE